MARANSGETYRKVLAIREFRYLWLAEILSVGGDQLARVALSVLVFDRTDSAALTGLTYGLTFVPTLLGNVFLAGFADHYPRRNVMIATDLVRAVMIALIALPGMPLWLLCVLVGGSTLFNGPFKAAQQALLPDVLPEELYILGMSLRTISTQTAQLAGFAAGGVLIAFLSPGGGILADAGTFLASAIFLACIKARAVKPAAGERALSPRGLARGAASYLADRRLLVLAAVSALNLFHIVPEGIAAPYAHQLGIGDFAVALILASSPLGGVIGAFVFGRLIPQEKRASIVGPAAVGASIALIPVFLPIGLPASLVLFMISGGLGGIFTMYASAMVVQFAPAQDRGRVAGIYTAVLHTSNGLGPMLGGLLAAQIGAAFTVGTAGVVSAAFAILIGIAWAKVRKAPTVLKRRHSVSQFE